MPALPGEYLVYLDIASGGSLIDAFEASEHVTVPGQADIRVDYVTITPSTVSMGEQAVATMHCTNYGNQSGTKDVICSFVDSGGAGLVDIHVPVTLAAGESKDIQILQDVGISSQVGHWIANADDKSATIDVIGGNAGVTGTVKSADTGLPLAGATVQVFGLPGTAVLTDSNGHFTIIDINHTAVRLDISCPNYATQMVNVAGLTSGVTKDIGVVSLSLLSAIVLVQLKMPASGKVYQAYDRTTGTIYYDVGFLVQNISGKDAIATLTVDISQSQSGGGSSAQLTLKPGQLSYWYGLPYPVGYKFDQSGPAHITAKVNGVVVGEVDVTVASIPFAKLSIVWTAKPPSTAVVGSTVSGKVKVTNPTNYPVTFDRLQATRISYVTSPPVTNLGMWSETLPAKSSKEYSASYTPTTPDSSSEMSFRLQWWSAGQLGDVSAYALTTVS